MEVAWLEHWNDGFLDSQHSSFPYSIVPSRVRAIKVYITCQRRSRSCWTKVQYTRG